MSSVPPPPPSSKRTPLNINAPGNPFRVNSQKPNYAESDFERASIWPLVTAVIAILISVLFIFLFHKNVWMSLVAYFCSPILVICCLGLDNYLQSRNISKKGWFIPNSNFGKILRGLSVISILIATPHINSLTSHISAWMAN